MPKVTEALHNFLTAKKDHHNGPDLLDRYLSFPGMETQVNVFQGKGQPVDGKGARYSDGLNEWHPIRIPKNANSEPSFRNYELRFTFDEHADAIGSTGWDWAYRCSRWVGFDYDAFEGHAKGVGVSDEQLERVKQAAMALPCVEVRRSTRGKGIHLYVLLETIPTENHTIHAALGRAVLGVISRETGFDFARHIDACGGNMWIWSRHATPENQGFALVKPATQTLSEADLPADWRDHVEVTGKKTKVRVQGIEEDDADQFDALATTHRRVPLDDTHKRIMDELRDMGGTVVWEPEHHLMQTHTCLLKRLMDDKRDELSLTGFFTTNSDGTDLGGPNCFLFPVENGRWSVYRFSPGVVEDESWEQDGVGWTTCSFNAPVDLATAAEKVGAPESKRGFAASFQQLASITRMMMGFAFTVPDKLVDRDVIVKERKDGRLDCFMDWLPDDPVKLNGWTRNKKKWERTLGKSSKAKHSPKDIVRFIISEDGKGLGWVARVGGIYIDDSQSGAIVSLLKYGIKDPGLWLSQEKDRPHVIGNVPFAEEYFVRPDGKTGWNRNAPQFAVEMAERDSAVTHYLLVLNHVGEHLTPAVLDDPWCIAHGIKTGGDYLLHWLASAVQRPFQPLPILYFFGPQGTGKSSFINMLLPLFIRGVHKIDKVFSRGNTFDGELAGAWIGYSEEANLTGRHAESAYAKYKDISFAKNISIERKGWEAYEQRNFLHLIQIGNAARYCPILDRDDSRFVVSKVGPIKDKINDVIMSAAWEAEAPYFVRLLKTLKLPEPTREDARSWLPVLWTEGKGEVIEAVAHVDSVADNELSALQLAEKYEEKIRLMAACGWLRKVTASEILIGLARLGEKDLPDARVFGVALKHLNPDGLYIKTGRSKDRRWISVHTRGDLWLEDQIEPKWSEEEAAEDEQRCDLLWLAYDEYMAGQLAAELERQEDLYFHYCVGSVVD